MTRSQPGMVDISASSSLVMVEKGEEARSSMEPPSLSSGVDEKWW